MSRTALHIELCIVFICGVLFADAAALAAQPGRSLFKSAPRVSSSPSKSSSRQVTRTANPVKSSAKSTARSSVQQQRSSSKAQASKSQPITRKATVSQSSKQNVNKSRTGNFGSTVTRGGTTQSSKQAATGSAINSLKGRSFSQSPKSTTPQSKVTSPSRSTVAGSRNSVGKNPALESAISRKAGGAMQSGRGTVDASKLKKDFVSKGSRTSTQTPVTKNLTDRLQSNIAKQRGGSTGLPSGKGQTGSKELPATDSAAGAARDAIAGSGRITRGGSSSGGNMNAQFIPGFGEAAEAAENAAGWLNDKAEEATNQAGKVIGDAANQAGRVAEDVANQAGRVAEDVANQAGRVVEDAADQAGRFIGDVAQETGKVVGEVTDQTGRVIGDVSDQAGRVIGDVVGKVQDEVNTGRDNVQDFIDDLVNDGVGGGNNDDKPAGDQDETGRDSAFPIDRGDFLPGFPFPQDGDDDRPADEPVDNNDRDDNDYPEQDYPEQDYPEQDYPEQDYPEQDYPEQDYPEQDEAPYDDYEEYEEYDEYYEEELPYYGEPSVTDLLIDLGNRLGAMPIGGGGGFAGGGVVEAPVVEPIVETIVEPVPVEPLAAQLPDLLVEDVRFVDAGDEQGQLGPRYRITIRNVGDAPASEFDVTLAAGIDFEDADQIAHSEDQVSGLAAGGLVTLDIRLPIDALGLDRDPQGRPVPFVLLLVAIDFDEQVVEQTRDNNRVLLDRREIMPIDFAAPQPTTTAAN